MMVKVMRLLLFFLLPLICYSSNDYGPFDIAFKSIKTCKAPKIKDCVLVTVNVQNSSVVYDMNVLENFSPLRAKVVASAKNKPTLRLQINNPCKHPFVRPLLDSLLNATSNCTVLKGHFNFVLNIESIFRKYYGGSFLYGNWSFYSTLYSEHCNFLCTTAVVELYPKNKPTS